MFLSNIIIILSQKKIAQQIASKFLTGVHTMPIWWYINKKNHQNIIKWADKKWEF